MTSAGAGEVRRGPDRYRVAVQDVGPSSRRLVALLKARGFGAALISDARLSDVRPLDPTAVDALLLPDAARFPIRAKGKLLGYLKAGGDMLVVGGPIFEISVKETAAEWERTLQAVEPGRLLADAAAAKWGQGTDNPASRTTWGARPSGLRAAPRALHVDVSDLRGWDTLSTPVEAPFPPGADLTILWARGGPRTRALLVEWRERDGSRWIATVPLTERWRKVVLAPDEFHYWQDSRSRGRGGPGDRLNTANVEALSIGLAQSHAAYPPGAHSYEVAGLFAGQLPAGVRKPDLEFPTLELFSPFYKCYRLPSLRPRAAALRKAAAAGDQAGPIVAPIPRPRGLGTGGAMHPRWIPLADIRDEVGRWRGTWESVYVNLSPPYRGSAWGQIAGAEDRRAMDRSILRVLGRMAAGVCLSRAGAEGFSFFTDEAIPNGFELANVSGVSRTAAYRYRIVGESDRRTVFSLSGRMAVPAGEVARRDGPRELLGLRPGVYAAVAELVRNGKVVDRIRQEFTVLATPRARRSSFVAVRGGDFVAPPPAGGTPLTPGPSPARGVPLTPGPSPARGEGSPQPKRIGRVPLPRPLREREGSGEGEGTRHPWYPYGVNYWQSNVAGTEPDEYRLHWLDAGFYDPEIVERDLSTLGGLGLDSVSIQLGRPDQIRQANDFIYRAARHGIRTNLFISGAHPFDTDEALFTRLIREGRFAGNPDIWAYDIAWEHHLGDHEERSRWDAEWEAWVIERYGSIAHAERDWGFPIPRDAAGKVTNPPDEQLRRDGPWLRMASAYERCADDVVSRRYGRVIGLIHALDPNHLISARSASQPSWTGWFAYDLLASGLHFDFSSPEGYGLNPGEAGFTVAYGRYAGNGKPVFWAEFGQSIYPYDGTGEKAAMQAALHRGFARMLLQSGANGLASWWSVGGFRVDERSDFGIIAPDGTPRPAALELARQAKADTRPRPVPTPSVWVTIDRDLHAAAYQAVYENNKRAYVDALRRGKHLGVRVAGTGTTSADCPLVAVGNVPYDGFNPLKYLNAEFESVEIRDVRGEWRPVEEGASIEVARGQPVEARVSAWNRGDARWLAGEGTGAVRLIGDDRPDERSSRLPRLAFSRPLAGDVGRYARIDLPAFAISPGLDSDAEAVFTFEATGRARFGERRRVILKVR